MTASTLALSDLSLDTGVPTESDRQQLLSEVAEYFAHGAVVKPGAVVFDVGANVGAFALLAAKQAQGNVSLHCFEPAPQNLQLLDKNLRSNKWLANTPHEDRSDGAHQRSGRRQDNSPLLLQAQLA
jgi:hypothetical protein